MFKLVVRWYNPFLRRVQDSALLDHDVIHTDGHVDLERSYLHSTIPASDVVVIFPRKF